MSEMPLVSIVIPVYNGSDYMSDAIDSAINQTYNNIEIIVVNDGSNDNGKTEEIALSYGDKIRYIKKENGGVSSALNTGIKNMKGKYFSWLSHDDLYTPDKVEKEINALKDSGSDDTVVLCDYIQVNAELTPIAVKHIDGREAVSGHLDWRKAVMFITKTGVNGCSMLIPKDAFEKVGLFDENLRYCQDVLMWWRIFLAKYSLLIIKDKCVLSRVHSRQATFTQSKLYYHDARYIGNIIPQRLLEVSTKDNNCIYEYAKGEAIRGSADICNKCVSISQGSGLFTSSQKAKLCGYKVYGVFRPVLRKAYRSISGFSRRRGK